MPILLLVAAPLIAHAQFTFVTNNDAITITGYTGPGGAVIIPAITNGLPVVAIGNAAFQTISTLTSVTIPVSVTNIGDFAFQSCSSLTAVYFQGNAPGIGGVNVFNGDNATIYYFPGTSGWSSSFAGRPAVMLNPPSPSGSLKVTLAPTATITNGARWQVDGGVVQPSGATVSGLSVGNHTVTFNPLNGWAMPATQTVTVSAFSTTTTSANYLQLFYTTNNGVITIWNMGTSVGPGLSIILPATINGRLVTSIGNNAFQYSTALTNVIIGTNIINIGQNAFYSCTGLRSVTIPDSVTNIGSDAFNYCTGLTNVTIGTNVIRIGDGAFLDCYNLAGVTIPGSVTHIGVAPFAWCLSLDAITVDPANLFYSGTNGILFNKDQTTLIQFPSGVVGSYAIPQTVNSLVAGAFAGGSLTNIIIGTNFTSIGQEVFEQSGLTSIIIPNSVTNIGVGAFQECSFLTSVIIPASVTGIEVFAFTHCYNLAGIYFLGNAPTSLDSDLFNYDNHAVAYYLPGTTGWTNFDASSGLGPAVLWLPQMQTGDDSFGVQNNQFGFNIAWASDEVVVVEACTDLSNPDWTPVATNTLASGSCYFSDPQYTNYPGRFYRLRSP